MKCIGCENEYNSEKEHCPVCGKRNPEYVNRRDNDDDDDEGGIFDSITSLLSDVVGKLIGK